MQEEIKFLPILKNLLTKEKQSEKECSNSDLELDRKIWSFVSDMLEEKLYIEGEFLASIPEDKRDDAMDQLKNMKFIGSAFNDNEWLSLLSSTFEKALTFSSNISNDVDIDKETTKKTENTVRALLLNLLQCAEKMVSAYTMGAAERSRLIASLENVIRVEIEKEHGKKLHINDNGDNEYDDMDDFDEKALIENDVREQATHLLKSMLG